MEVRHHVANKNSKEEETQMKKALLFATTLALALGARAETVNSVGTIFASDGGTVSPPIIVIGPSAPKKPGPVAHFAEIAVSDGNTVPPINSTGPTAPKKPAPVAHFAEIAVSDNGTLPPIKGAGPTAPKKPAPIAHFAEIA